MCAGERSPHASPTRAAPCGVATVRDIRHTMPSPNTRGGTSSQKSCQTLASASPYGCITRERPPRRLDATDGTAAAVALSDRESSHVMCMHDTRRHRARGLARRFRTATRALLLAAITSHSAGAQEVSADAGFARLAFGDCPSDLAYLNQVTGWQVAWPVEWGEIVTGRGDRSGALRRWSRAAAALDARSDSLRHRAPTRPIAPRAVVVRVLAQVDALVRTLSMDHVELLRIPGDASFGRAWRSLLVDTILPAIQRHRTVLASTWMRRAPTAPGIDARRAGESCCPEVLAYWLGEPLAVAALEATSPDPPSDVPWRRRSPSTRKFPAITCSPHIPGRQG